MRGGVEKCTSVSGNLCVGGAGPPPPSLSHLAFPFREGRREQTHKLWEWQEGGISGDPDPCSRRSSGGGAGRPGPCLLSPPLPFLQVSPSDSTLKREFSLDLVVMATLLTKSCFHGGGWLTQKLRGLGEGVRSDGFISRACFPNPHQGCPSFMDPSAGPLVPRPSPCDCHEASIPSGCGLYFSHSWLSGQDQGGS